ncbi:MAG: hypothetical protein V1928_05700 [Parcubacteria group bacterium]
MKRNNQRLTFHEERRLRRLVKKEKRKLDALKLRQEILARKNNKGLATVDPDFPRVNRYDPEFKKTEFHLQKLHSMISALINRSFVLIPTRSVDAGSTDAVKTVYFNPYPFEQDMVEEGYGIGLHEGGHINHSPYASDLLNRAQKQGGTVLQTIVNILLDRKDDDLTAQDAPGFAAYIWKRLNYILPKQRAGIEDQFEDFLYACKKRTRAKFKPVLEAMRKVRRVNLDESAGPEQILALAIKIKDMLFTPDSDELKKLEAQLKNDAAFRQLVQMEFSANFPNPKPTKSELAKFKWHISAVKNFKKYAAQMEKREQGPAPTEQEEEILILIAQKIREDSGTERIVAGEGSRSYSSRGAGPDKEREIEVINVDPAPQQFNEYAIQVGMFAPELQERFHVLTDKKTIEIRGLDEGELDMNNMVGIAIGSKNVYKEDATQLYQGAAISLVLDISSSINEIQLNQIKKLGVLFCLALDGQETFRGKVWAFNDSFYYCNKAEAGNGLVTLEAAHTTCQGEALELALDDLSDADFDKKICIVICDGAPNSPAKVNAALNRAKHMRVECVLILVLEDDESAKRKEKDKIALLNSEHNSLFKWKMLYTDFNELIAEFGNILEMIASGQEPNDLSPLDLSKAKEIS